MDVTDDTLHGIEEHAHLRAKFRQMKEGTQEDWSIIGADYMAFAKGLPDRVLTHLRLLDGDFGGFPVASPGALIANGDPSAS